MEVGMTTMVIIIIIIIVYRFCNLYFNYGIEYPSYNLVVDGHRLRVSKTNEDHHETSHKTDYIYVEMNGIRYPIDINDFAIINLYEPITISQPLHDALTAAGIANKQTIREIENLLEQCYSDSIDPQQWLWDIIMKAIYKMGAIFHRKKEI